MSDAAAPAPAATTAPAGAAKKRSLWTLIAPLALLIIAGAGGGAVYFLMFGKPPAAPGEQPKAEAAMPAYLEIKPFVVSLRGADDAAHFVQLGINLMLSGADLGALISADEPEVDDAIRLAALQFKIEDIETPAGVEKMRAAILTDVNRVLLQRLGAERIGKLGNGKDAVKTLYFTQLVIE